MNVAAARQRDVAVALEAATDAAELRQRLRDRRVRHADLAADRDGGQRVAHVVHAGERQLDRQIRRALRLRDEAHAPADVGDVDRAQIGVVGEAVGDERLRHVGQDRAHVGVVDADHRHAVERQPLQEVDERARQLREVVLVGLHVVGVDVRHHREHRRQVQERRVRLVGLGDQELALAEARVGVGGQQPAADDERRDRGRLRPAPTR